MGIGIRILNGIITVRKIVSCELTGNMKQTLKKTWGI